MRKGKGFQLSASSQKFLLSSVLKSLGRDLISRFSSKHTVLILCIIWFQVNNVGCSPLLTRPTDVQEGLDIQDPQMSWSHFQVSWNVLINIGKESKDSSNGENAMTEGRQVIEKKWELRQDSPKLSWPGVFSFQTDPSPFISKPSKSEEGDRNPHPKNDHEFPAQCAVLFSC